MSDEKRKHQLGFEVDVELWPMIKQFTWREDKKRKDRSYFYTTIAGKKIYLHKLIFGLFAKFSIDHIDQNPNNNCLENLRPCTHSQNISNSVRPKRITKYRGTYKHYSGWAFHCTKDGKKYSKSGFKNEIDAARAYDSMAIKLHGEFAVLNFPGELK